MIKIRKLVIISYNTVLKQLAIYFLILMCLAFSSCCSEPNENQVRSDFAKRYPDYTLVSVENIEVSPPCFYWKVKYKKKVGTLISTETEYWDYCCSDMFDSKQTIKVRTSEVQNDSLTSPNQEYAKEIYNPFTETRNFSYDYSNKWDLDGDRKNDSVFFIGNGGAHVYFHLRVILSSNGLVQDFSTIQLDMPYFEEKELLDKYGKNVGVQFIVHDFDADGIVELYLNFDNPFGSIPEKWKKEGVTSKYVIMDFSEQKLNVKDYQNR